ncbi:MAG: hypothetical protein K2X38_01735 [Gemmataceae bacterium]|nr:hypothetical protein [Gemmataceae bacterium]
MSRFDDRRSHYDDDPYEDDRLRLETLPHSAPGIASLIAAILAGLLAFGLIAIAAVHGNDIEFEIERKSGAGVGFIFLFLGSGATVLVGIVLGIVGCVQAHRRKIFAILGLVLNLMIVLGMCGLMAIGFAAG